MSPDLPSRLRRDLLVLAAGVVGLCVGLLVHLVGWTMFPGVIYGEAALMHADGESNSYANFYDRTTWWDAVPLVCAVLAAMLAFGSRRKG